MKSRILDADSDIGTRNPMFQKLKDYVKSTRLEMEKVTWPTRRGIMYDTVLIVVISLALAVFLGALDLLYQYLLNMFIL